MRRCVARLEVRCLISFTIQRLTDRLTGYFEPEVLPIDIADRWYISLPFKAVKSVPSEATSQSADLDKYVAPTNDVLTNSQPSYRDLRDGLAKCGYLLPPPDDVFLDRLSIRRGKNSPGQIGVLHHLFPRWILH